MMDRIATGFAWIAQDIANVPPAIVSTITDKEHTAYAKALFTCVNGDGRITDTERDWLVGYAASNGHPDSVLEMLQTYQGGETLDDILQDTPLAKASGRFMIYDALRACLADGELHRDERAQIVNMAGLMGVPESVVAELEAVIAQEAKLRARRYDLLVAPLMPSMN